MIMKITKIATKIKNFKLVRTAMTTGTSAILLKPQKKQDRIQKITEVHVSVRRKDQSYKILPEPYQKFETYNRFSAPASTETACNLCRISATSL